MAIAQRVWRLISPLAQRISYTELAKEVGIPEGDLQRLASGMHEISEEIGWKLIRIMNKYNYFDLLQEHGIQPVSFDISAPFKIHDPPVGYAQDYPLVPLKERRTNIAGYPVDFPLGLPASVLAANAKWLEFYAHRGFDILTYKTVRTQYRAAHPWPNWVFLKDPVEITDPSNPPIMMGYPDYWPEDRLTASMVNSFGVPSLAPDWWQDDIRRAREIIVEGHQVLIVSVVASKNETQESMIEDFVKVALMAKNVGADIIEANFSCPNTPGDSAGYVYQSPEVARRIAKAMKEALGKTPFFVKIGYLTKPELYTFVDRTAEFINGIVAINTISTMVVDDDGNATFPGRETAGISGWAIKPRAQEVARNLVDLRKAVVTKYGKTLTLLGLGGVLTREDCMDYLDNIGVDGVETCTGAFLNPNLGLEVRCDEEAAKRKPSRLGFELDFFKKFFEDVLFHPTRRSRIRADSETRRVVVERLIGKS